MKKYLNGLLSLLLILIVGLALYHQLGDFAHLKNADGVLTDMRSLVLWDVRVPRIGLAILTGAGLALAGNAMQGIFQNPLASPGLLGVRRRGRGVGELFNCLSHRQKLWHNHDDFKRAGSEYVAGFGYCLVVVQCRQPVGIGRIIPLVTRFSGVGEVRRLIDLFAHGVTWRCLPLL